jgi:hypothetical protein
VPAWKKVLLAFAIVWGVVFAVAVVHGLVSPSPAHRRDYGGTRTSSTQDSTPDEPPRYSSQQAEPDQSQAAAANRQLAAYQAEYNQLNAMAAQCTAQINDWNGRQMVASLNGQTIPPPACEQPMNQWNQRMAFLEVEIHRMQTGDYRSNFQEITPYRAPSGSSPSRGSSAPSSGSGGAGDYDMGHIREHGIYVGEDGEEYELQLHKYYFRDRATGQFAWNDYVDELPDNYRQWERLRQTR